MTNLDSFLAEQAIGETVERDGQFALSPEEALRRLSNYSFQDPGDWLLKIVQCAVQVGAPNLDFSESRGRLVCRLALPEAWTFEEFQAAVENPNYRCEAALDSLRHGLWPVVLGRRARLKVVHTVRNETWTWSSKGVSRKEGVGFGAASSLVIHEPGSLGTPRDLMSPLLVTLKSRAYCCPIPLTVENQRIDGLCLVPEHGFHGSSEPLLLGSVTQGPSPFQLPKGDFEMHETLFQGAFGPLRQNSEDYFFQNQPVALAWLLSRHLGRDRARPQAVNRLSHFRSTVRVVRHGVESECFELDLPAGPLSIALWVDASDLGTDLSGFALQESPEHRARLIWALQTLEAHLPSSLATALKPPGFGARNKWTITGAGIAALHLFSWGGPAALLGVPSALLAGTVGALLDRHDRLQRQSRHRRLEICLAALKAELQRFSLQPGKDPA